MKGLFATIFIRFWLTVVLVGLALAISVLVSFARLQANRRDLGSPELTARARDAAHAFETSGRSGLDRYLRLIERRYSVEAFTFGPDGNELLDRPTPPDVREVAKVVRRSGDMFVGGGFSGQRAAGPSGKVYSLVLSLGGTSGIKAIVASVFLFQLPVISLIGGGLFCYLITRHITTPVLQLRVATERLAAGKLDTRIAGSLGRRRDEISALGGDFDRMAERIESLVVGQQRLLGDVSHELRSPLSRLTVALGLLKQQGKEDPRELLDRIGVEAHRLDDLIGQLLTLSRIDSGTHAGTRGPVDLTTMVHEIASDADFEARACGRAVAVAAADACTIVGFDELLRSAIENVVRNAVRHTREGTCVDVSVHRSERRDGRSTTVRIRDHGPGVPDAMLTEIFVPFRRVAGDEATGGAGLGLAITERAVALHGGTVRATNAADGGLIVEIEL